MHINQKHNSNCDYAFLETPVFKTIKDIYTIIYSCGCVSNSRKAEGARHWHVDGSSLYSTALYSQRSEFSFVGNEQLQSA